MPQIPLCVSLCTTVAWVKAKDEELLRAEAVAGVPYRVASQITEVEVHIHILFSYPFSVH